MKRSRGMNRSAWLWMAAGLAAGAVLWPTGIFAAEKITFRLDWIPGPEHSPLYRAVDQGYFKAQGIDVEVIKGEGSNVSVKLVGNKTNPFGFCSSDVTLIGRTKGLKVKAVSQIYQRSPAGIMSSEQNPVKKPGDLKGKKIGVDPKSTAMQQLIATLRLNKFDRSGYEEIPVGKALMQALVGKRVNAAVSYNYIQPVLLRAKGYKIHNVTFADWGLRIYSMGIITHDDTLARNPKLVRGVVRAVLKGYYDAKKDPARVLQHTLKRKPKAEASYVAYAKNSFPKVLELIDSPDTDKHELGWSTRGGWEAMQSTLLSLGLIKKKIDVGEVFTNKFLPGKM
ncbi:MAG: ABC transporter substrate-binding protein [Nitrospinota bacterium]